MRDVQAGSILEWFVELEQRLIGVLGYVPFSEKTKDVSIPRISSIILEAGSLVDTIFRETIVTEKTPDRLSMRDFAPYFEEKYHLSALRSIAFIWPPAYIVPFEPWSNAEADDRAALTWWKTYTDMKHSRVRALDESTIGKGIESMAALHQVMSQTPHFWRPLLRREMLTSASLHVVNFVRNLEQDKAWDHSVTVESALFCTTLGATRFPERIGDLRGSSVVSLGGRRLQRFLGAD